MKATTLKTCIFAGILGAIVCAFVNYWLTLALLAFAAVSATAYLIAHDNEQ